MRVNSLARQVGRGQGRRQIQMLSRMQVLSEELESQMMMGMIMKA